MVLRTTLIAGFHGESKRDFAKLCEFVKDTNFERLGCFAYSAEEGTPAAEFDGQLDEDVKKHRAEVIMDQQYLSAEKFNKKMVFRSKTWSNSSYCRSYWCRKNNNCKSFNEIL